MSGAVLHERRDAMELVAAEVERARAGAGRLVLLRGASGTGRTAVLEAVTDHASTQGMRVLRTRCSPDRSTAPLDTVLQLFASVAEFEMAAEEDPLAPRTTGAVPHGCGTCCARPGPGPRSWWPWMTSISPTTPHAAGSSKPPGGSIDYRSCSS